MALVAVALSPAGGAATTESAVRCTAAEPASASAANAAAVPSAAAVAAFGDAATSIWAAICLGCTTTETPCAHKLLPSDDLLRAAILSDIAYSRHMRAWAVSSRPGGSLPK